VGVQQRGSRPSRGSVVVAAAVIACTSLSAGCSSGAASADVADLRDARAPYYYVGSSFDGLKISHVERYQRGVGDIIYGTCEANSDQGCGPPLELQHRLCHGAVTVVIFTGQGAKRGSAARAADALRPLSRGARERERGPNVAFDRSPAC